MPLLSKKQREVLESSPVRVALDTFARNQTPKNKHELESALVRAGIASRIERKKLIAILMRTRKYGDS